MPDRNTFLAFSLYLIGTVGAMLPTTANAEDTPRTITIAASGFMTARPDRVQITVGVITQDATAKTALEKNSKRFRSVVDGIKGLGIAAKDIATEQFHVTPVYARRKTQRGDRHRSIEAYRITNSVRISIQNIKQIGAVIDRATERGANKIDAIQFIISNLETKLDAARREAMRNAIRKAKLYAKAAGAQLGAIQTISEQRQGHQPRPVMRQRAALMSAPTPIEPGKREISVRITTTWLLE